MESLTIIPITVSLFGLLVSCGLHKKLRVITVSLAKVKIEKPESHTDLFHYLEVKNNKDRLDSFYNASNFFKKILHFVFLFLFVIIIITFIFVFKSSIDTPDIRVELLSPETKSEGILIFKSATGKTKEVELKFPNRKTKLLQINPSGDITIFEIPVEDRRPTYFSISKDDRVEKMFILELVFSILIFVFILLIAFCYFIIGKMEEDITKFNELKLDL